MRLEAWSPTIDKRSRTTGLFAAALACLQPGIDPIFLTLLSAAHHIDPVHHGWVVGATQSGMALGSLITMRLGARLLPGALPWAAVAALAASIGTALVDQIVAILLLRCGYGIAMGLTYTSLMAGIARWRPSGAYGAVFLIQLLLSTFVALALPTASAASAPAIALLLCGLVPSAMLLLILRLDKVAPTRSEPPQILPGSGGPDAAAWALAVASVLFICTTMMVWSFTGALAIAADFDPGTIGWTVALGSLAGAATAPFVMREKVLVPLWITGVLCGLALLAPMAAIPTGRVAAFLCSVILLNIGSTTMIIRCSGAAAARCRDPFFLRVVAFTHPAGMILGPTTGSLLAGHFGLQGLEGGAATTLSAGCAALVLAAFWSRPARTLRKCEIM